jgi:hypothetical protein
MGFKYNIATMLFNIVMHMFNDKSYREQMNSFGLRFGFSLLQDLGHALTPYPWPAQAFMSIEKQIAHNGYQVEKHSIKT